MMKKYRKINVFALAKFQAVLLLLVGLLCGILYSFGGLLIDVLVSLDFLSPIAMETPGLSYGTILAFGALIGMPVIFATLGFLLGILEALLYNIFTKWFHFLRLEFHLFK